jgi:hypothetical protein
MPVAITYNIYVNFVNDKIKDYFVNRKNYIETLSGHTSLSGRWLNVSQSQSRR